MSLPRIGVLASHRMIEDTFPAQITGSNNLESVATVAKALPLIIPALAETREIGGLLDACDGFLLPGGRANVHPSFYNTEPAPAYEPYDINRDAVALELTRACIETGTPVFGVCRGLQEMNVALGGALHPEIRDIPGRMNHRMPKDEPDLDVIFQLRHGVRLTPGGKFATLFGAEVIRVNSLHGQGILTAGDRVEIEGYAEDGTPEAISIREAPGFALGVQWHAEYKTAENPVNRKLFEAFGDAARSHQAARRR